MVENIGATQPNIDHVVDADALAISGGSIPVEVWCEGETPTCVTRSTRCLMPRDKRNLTYLYFLLEPVQRQARKEERRLVMRLDLPDRVLLYFFDKNGGIQSRSFMFERAVDLCHLPDRDPNQVLVAQQAQQLLDGWLRPGAPHRIEEIAPRIMDAADLRRLQQLQEWIVDEPDELRFQRHAFTEDDTIHRELIVDKHVDEHVLTQVLEDVLPGYAITVTPLSAQRLALRRPLLSAVAFDSEKSMNTANFIGEEDAQILFNPLDDGEGLLGQPLTKGDSFMFMNLRRDVDGEIHMDAMGLPRSYCQHAPRFGDPKEATISRDDVGWYRIDVSNMPVSLIVPAQGAILTLSSFYGGRRGEIQVTGIHQRAHYLERTYWFGHKWLAYLNPEGEEPRDLAEKTRAVTREVRMLARRNHQWNQQQQSNQADRN